MLFDSHAHLDDRAFDLDRSELIRTLPERGIGLLMDPGCSLAASYAAAALAEETPLGRIGTAEEVAESVWFLAGGGAPFLTGQVIQPNGGIVI